MPSSSHRARAASTTPSSKTRSISISGIARCAVLRDGLALVEHAVDAVDQPLQGGAVDLIGAAEVVHDARFSAAWLSAFQTLSARA